MRRILSLSLLAVLSVGAVACGKDSPTQPIATIEQTTFAPGLNVNLAAMTKTGTGLYYQDVTPGTGDVVRLADSVDVVFNGYLPVGTAFALANVLRFRIGVTPVMAGWTQGLVGAPVGGRRRLIIPPELGYGSHAIRDVATGNVVIPANSILVYDINIIGVTR